MNRREFSKAMMAFDDSPKSGADTEANHRILGLTTKKGITNAD
jgi:hypothetical protein